MNNIGKYVYTAIFVAIAVHLAVIHWTPRMLMNVAISRLAPNEQYNSWRIADRVTPLSRAIVRPSPDFAYAACPYDLGQGPLTLRVAPWRAYWSLSLYAANSDNYFVIDDREARNGAEIILVRAGRTPPEDAPRVVQSPSDRGIALIRRLAPTLDEYNAASETARGDVCGAFVASAS